MVARVKTVAFQGIEVLEVDVQVQIVSSSFVGIVIVGLPDKAVGESRERVRGALGAIGLGLPPKRVVVNLAPADVLKEGSHFDLPIALAVLGAMGVLPVDELARFTALGELGLDGTIAAVAGVLPAAYAIYASLGAVLIVVLHRENIRRLLTGKEPKIGHGGERRAAKAPGIPN